MKKFFGDKKAIFVFTFPAILIFTVMVMWPLFQVVYRSLYKWNGLGSGTFIGLDNYAKLLNDSVFKISIKNGLIFAIFITIFQLGIGTVLAFAVSNVKVKGRNFFRIVYFLPVVLSITVVCQLWLSVFNAEFGLLNKFFEIIGLNFHQDWLSDRNNAIYAIAFVNAWQYMGYHFSLILAGIKSVPADYYEAAQIDGASRFISHIKITIPLIAETYKFCLIMSITGGLNAFTNMFIMVGGGPGNSTYTLTYMMYSSAYRTGKYGYGLAAATSLVLECLIAVLVINRLVAREKTVS
ncbi:MAG: carbohydrate ABC transporter permease [Clostridiaceae bacterium]